MPMSEGERQRDDREMVVDSEGNVQCMNIYGLRVCVGDFIQVYPRSLRLSYIQGRIARITYSSIVLENEENTVSVRFSEIRMIRKPKIAKQ
jgi:hypothetical protein